MTAAGIRRPPFLIKTHPSTLEEGIPPINPHYHFKVRLVSLKILETLGSMT